MKNTQLPLLTASALELYRGSGLDTKSILNGGEQCHFSLNQHELLYLGGPSGVGKSSLLWALARLHPLTSGQLCLTGKAYQTIPITHWRAEVALLPQKPVLFPGTVVDNLYYPLQHFRIQKQRLLANGHTLPDQQVLLDNLQAVGLETVSLNREATSLSGGQQARLALIRTLLTRPTVLLADELFASIDQLATELVLQRLQTFCEEGGAILLVHHYTKLQKNSMQLILDGHGNLLKIK